MTISYPIPFIIVVLVVISFLVITIRKGFMKSKNFFRNLLLILLSISFLFGVSYYEVDKTGDPFFHFCAAIVVAISITYMKE